MRLAAADLTKEVAEGEMKGLRARALDAAALLGERSEEIEALEALGDARQVTKQVGRQVGRQASNQAGEQQGRQAIR